MIVLEALEVDDFVQHQFCFTEFLLDLDPQGCCIRAAVALDLQGEQPTPTGKEEALAGGREN